MARRQGSKPTRFEQQCVVFGIPLVDVEIENPDGTTRTVQRPDFGLLKKHVVETSPGFWVGQRGGNCLAVQFLGVRSGNLIFVGTCTAGVISYLKNELGAKVGDGADVILRPALLLWLQNRGVKLLVDKALRTPVSIIPPHVIAGHDPVLASIPDSRDPDEVEPEA